MEAVDVANKVVELLEAAAVQAGQTATTAWPYVVRYTWAKAVTGCVISVIALGVAGYAFNRYCAWKREDKGKDRYNQDEVTPVATVIIMIVSSILALVTAGLNLPDVIEPVGATISSLISSIKK